MPKIKNKCKVHEYLLYYDCMKTIHPRPCSIEPDDSKVERLNSVSNNENEYCKIMIENDFIIYGKILNIYDMSDESERQRLADMLQENAEYLQTLADEYQEKIEEN